MPHQRVPMPPAALEATVVRYNAFVDAGVDADFGKPKPLYKIRRPPFYAAWATPVVHDSRAGLRIDRECRVIDMNGEVIPGLYCGGESAGGFSQHGLARALCQGWIAGHAATGTAPRAAALRRRPSRSLGGGELVLSLGREVGGVVALVQLARRLARKAVDHAPALHRRSR
jgi:succinate dehydrogenase/fumarate reductase flavoprotein subunit